MGGHEEHLKVPDYRKYRVENVPELVKCQKMLSSHGLCDPWARNEVWRYDPKQWGTKRGRMLLTVSRGFKFGLIAAVITVVAGKFLGSDSHHDEGHH